MLRIPDCDLDPVAKAHIDTLQTDVDGQPGYAGRVARAKALWDAKLNTNDGKVAFGTVRATLAGLCFGAERCAYCGDSAADEIEHVLPKSFFPDHAFRWSNYVFACGVCNGKKHKGDKYACLDARGRLVPAVRKRNGPVLPPPAGRHALIDPRSEDPLDFLTLGLVAWDPNIGCWREGQFDIGPRDRLPAADRKRAEYTRDTLGLDRDVLRRARRSAFRAYHALIGEYARDKADGAAPAVLDDKRDGILRMPHPLVFVEMQRQSGLEPLAKLFDPVPEALTWRPLPPLTAPTT